MAIRGGNERKFDGKLFYYNSSGHRTKADAIASLPTRFADNYFVRITREKYYKWPSGYGYVVWLRSKPSRQGRKRR